jgi:redox-sensitive bicupin YhaK (pirin superfamily)
MSIIQTILPTTHDLGDFKVRRVLPSKARRMVGPFIFVDELGPAQLAIGTGMDVRPHPHINLATVTWLFGGEFSGAIEHRDSLGTFATIRPGQVNLMTAGRGIVHSERSPADERAVLLTEGEATLDGQALERYVLYVLAPGTAMKLSSQGGGRAMLLGGEAFTTPRHAWWNFVSSSRERINQAKADWREGRFPTVPGDTEEFIPLPEVPLTITEP